MGGRLACGGHTTEPMGVTGHKEEPANGGGAAAGVAGGGGGGGGSGGGGGTNGGSGEEEEEGGRVLLELVASLASLDAAGIQIKLNTYLSRRCGAGLVFLILVSEDEELTVHVLGSTTLSTPLKIPVSNNSFSQALTSRRHMTLEDIEEPHRENLWRLLGLVQESERLGGVVTGAGGTTANHHLQGGKRLRNGANTTQSVDESISSSSPSSGHFSGMEMSVDSQGKRPHGGKAGGGVGGGGSRSPAAGPTRVVTTTTGATTITTVSSSNSSSSSSRSSTAAIRMHKLQRSPLMQTIDDPTEQVGARIGDEVIVEGRREVVSASGRRLETGGGGRRMERGGSVALPSSRSQPPPSSASSDNHHHHHNHQSPHKVPKLSSYSTSLPTSCDPQYITSTSSSIDGGLTSDLTTPTSLMCVPIAAPGREATSVLVCLLNKVTPGDFGLQEIKIVENCFKYTVGMLVNTVEAERERRLRTQCQALLSVAQNLFTHLDDVSVLLREIMSEARRLTDAERCSLFLLDRENDQLVAKVFDGERKEESSGEVRLPATQGIAGHVASTGTLLNIRDAYSHPLFYKGFDECTGFKTRNILCFPIKQEAGEVLGVAELCNKTTGLHFTRFDEEIATAFSSYCGISITNSLLYKKVVDWQVRSKLSNELMMFHMKVTKEEVERLVEAEVVPPSHFHPEFCSFRYFPRLLTEGRTPLAVLSMMEDLGMVARFRLSRDSLARFTLMVRKGYRDPPYHNWLHAFSVTHFAYLLIHNLRLTEQGALTHLEALALIVSSMCHDLDHRGTTNSFQVASNSVLASLYSSEGSVMERHHLAQAMCILNTDDCNFLENLTRQEYTKFLDLMRDIILATDLAHHLRILSELREIAVSGFDSSSARHHQLLICLLMTAADLSDQTKDWHSSKHVAELIYKEFFTQGDLEKAMGNMPLEMMDREKAFIPELQLQFLDDVAIPVYEIVAKLFPEAEEPYSNVKANFRHWSRLRDVYKRRKPASTSSLEVFEDDTLEDELEIEQQA